MATPPLQRILYIDDEEDIREIAAMALELDGGIAVTAVGSGREALARVAELRPDLILIDVMMPEMDGPATLAALRRLPDQAATPIVFITAKAQTSELQGFLQLGA